MARRLDYWAKADTFAWLDAREDDVFARYLEMGSVPDLIAELGSQCGGLGYHTFYAWIRDNETREEKWEETLGIRGYISEQEGQDIVDTATQQTANVDRLKFEAKMRRAEWQNRAVFGKRPDVQIALGVGGEWAQALNAVLSTGDEKLTIASQPKALLSAPPTGQGSTRASGGTVLGTGSSGMEVHPDGEPSHD